MIKNSFMAAIIIFNSTTAFSAGNNTNCSLLNEDSANNATTIFEFCKAQAPNTQMESLSVLNKDARAQTTSPFTLKQNKSSGLESLIVVLFMPMFIILLFSRFAKSAK